MTDGARNEISLLHAYPILPAEDYEAALAYYRDKLGFTVSWEWGNPPFRAGVARGSVEFQLVCDPEHGPTHPGQVYVHMTGVDAFYRECVERGASVTVELGERPWRMKDFRIVDPSGNRLGFGETL